MHLSIDYREQRSGIIELLDNLHDIHLELNNLEYGDYIINKKIIFERKTLPDFLVSIKNSRFFRQSYRMIDRKIPYILILEGNRESIKNSGMKREAVQGALMHIAVFLGIPVIRSVDIKETLQLMIQAGKQIEKYEEENEYRVYNRDIKVKKNKIEKMKLQIIQNLPGVGQQRAKAILKEFSTLNRIFSCDADNLLKVDGIGKKTAKDIVNLINR